ncbi:hypothetical protein [Calycomorphotria hydatis]|uniref:Uncharacterized protein n=1 Tax=Calycomorphotria hydatis TaxID=2528027 RepID=A0A517T8V6_9PLAN|nr:hypothetical protein [Calycomorphotria hydatis]QDT64793.1 hypothetical protein V22_20360 [Calycomorphotria hydatis]
MALRAHERGVFRDVTGFASRVSAAAALLAALIMICSGGVVLAQEEAVDGPSLGPAQTAEQASAEPAASAETAEAAEEKPAAEEEPKAEEKPAPEEVEAATEEVVVEAVPTGPVGLDGMLPEFVPDEISPGAWSLLGGNWQNWSNETAAAVSNFYAVQGTQLPEQAMKLEGLKQRLGTMQTARLDPKYRSISTELDALYGPLARRVALQSVALKLMSTTGEDLKNASVMLTLEDVQQAAVALKQTMARIRGGSNWVKYIGIDEVLAGMAEGSIAPEDIAAIQNTLKLTDPEETSGEAQKTFLAKEVFVNLREALGKTLAAAQLEPPQVDVEATRQAVKNLLTASEEYERDVTDENAAKLMAAFKQFESLNPVLYGMLAQVFQEQYLAPNVRFVADEDFVSKMFEVERNESGPVDDRVNGTPVRGTQSTTSKTGVDLKPGDGIAKFFFTLNGRVTNNTRAFSSRATISSRGNHQFRATKDIVFDGEKFEIGEADINVTPSIRNVGASTSYDGGPFAGRARGRALGVANSRLPASREHARRSITSQVLPRFDEESTKLFTDFNNNMGPDSDYARRMKESGVVPIEQNASSTEDLLFVEQKYVSTEGPKLMGSSVITPPAASGKAVLYMHESVLNAAARNWNFAGREMTAEEVQSEIEAWMSGFLGREFNFSPTEGEQDPAALIAAAQAAGEEVSPELLEAAESASGSKFAFADEEPIHFQIADGAVQMILRAGIVRPGKEAIPTQIVTVPFIPVIEGDDIVLEQGTVSVLPAEMVSNRGMQIARAAAMRKAIEQSLRPSKQSRIINYERENAPPVEILIEDISAQDGWLQITGS